MKKLIIAFAAVAMAACAQAVQVKWASGLIYTPDSEGSIGATWNGSKWTFSQSAVSTKGTVTAVIWESATAISALGAGKLYEAYEKGQTESLISGATVYTGSNGTTASLITVNGGKTYSTGDNVYAAVLYVLEDGDDTWYMENYATATMKSSATTQMNLAEFAGGSSSSTVASSATPMEWTSANVPEPTSGLLLLLGMAGLALRRRRA